MQTGRDATRERQLFDAFVAGDDAAFATLFQRYHDRLVRDARRYVAEEAAEDLVQDVFALLWRRRTRWSIRSTVRKYLHSAVRNRARDLVERSRMEQRAVDSYRQVVTERQIASPEDELLTQELASAIERGLGTCAARCRAALLLLEEHRRYADIAHELGVRPTPLLLAVAADCAPICAIRDGRMFFAFAHHFPFWKASLQTLLVTSHCTLKRHHPAESTSDPWLGESLTPTWIERDDPSW